MMQIPQLSNELRAGLAPAAQEYVTYLESVIRSTSVLDVDLETASREELVGLIFRLMERQRIIEARLRELEKLVTKDAGGGGE